MAALLLPLVGGVACVARLGDLPSHRLVGVPALVLSGIAWLIALELVRRVRPLGGREGSRGHLLLLWVGWMGVRLPVVIGELELSDDCHRYVWEGGLVAEGISPYAFSPAAPELAAYRERWERTFARVNHPTVSAAYPPLAELVFAGTTSLAGGPDGSAASILVFRVLFAISDLLVSIVLVSWLRRNGQPPLLALAWAWCPLVALEYAGSAHFDVLAILFLLSAVVLHERNAGSEVRRTSSSDGTVLALLAAGGLLKLLPAALLPYALRRIRSWRALYGLLIVCGSALVPFFIWKGGFSGVLSGPSEYAFRWESFSLVFRWIEAFWDRFLERDEGWLDPRRVARMCAGGAWCLVAWDAWRRKLDLGRAAHRLVAAFLLFTPTLHPWYLTWIAPFLARSSSRAWAFLLASAPLLYWPLTEWKERGLWLEPSWLWPVVALPFLVTLAAELVQSRRGARAWAS